MSQKQYKPHYEHLKNKWLDRQRETQKSLFERHHDAFAWLQHHTQQMAVGTMSVFMLLGLPADIANYQPTHAGTVQQSQFDKRVLLAKDLSYVLPDTVQPLNESQEKVIEKVLQRHTNLSVHTELQGKRLNRSYGYIGAEQHLARYPGDTMASHFQTQEDAQKYYKSGMAPGLGAWRYFAPSASEMTQKEIDQEKYYIAVQTFLAPGYNENVREYSQFFKFRKMLVVNPENGRAMVVVIGDAGPGTSTGKHLGGSPEVMDYLKRVDGKAKGPVLYFFIDDPEDKVPLGPVEL